MNICLYKYFIVLFQPFCGIKCYDQRTKEEKEGHFPSPNFIANSGVRFFVFSSHHAVPWHSDPTSSCPYPVPCELLWWQINDMVGLSTHFLHPHGGEQMTTIVASVMWRRLSQLEDQQHKTIEAAAVSHMDQPSTVLVQINTEDPCEGTTAGFIRCPTTTTTTRKENMRPAVGIAACSSRWE